MKEIRLRLVRHTLDTFALWQDSATLTLQLEDGGARGLPERRHVRRQRSADGGVDPVACPRYNTGVLSRAEVSAGYCGRVHGEPIPRNGPCTSPMCSR